MEFDELVEHLDDLIAISESEGLNVFAASLRATAMAARLHPTALSIRDPRPRTSIDVRCAERGPIHGERCERPVGHEGAHKASTGGVIPELWATGPTGVE